MDGSHKDRSIRVTKSLSREIDTGLLASTEERDIEALISASMSGGWGGSLLLSLACADIADLDRKGR